MWETRNMPWLRPGGDSHWAGLGFGPWILSSHSLKPANINPTHQQPSNLILPQSIFLGPPTVASMRPPSCDLVNLVYYLSFSPRENWDLAQGGEHITTYRPLGGLKPARPLNCGCHEAVAFQSLEGPTGSGSLLGRLYLCI